MYLQPSLDMQGGLPLFWFNFLDSLPRRSPLEVGRGFTPQLFVCVCCVLIHSARAQRPPVWTWGGGGGGVQGFFLLVLVKGGNKGGGCPAARSGHLF